MQSQGKAYAFGLASVLIWSTVASAFKLGLRHLDPLPLLLWASIVSWLVMLFAVIFKGKWTELWNSSASSLRLSAILGFLNPFLYYVVLLKAYDLLPAQEAQPLNYTWAITLALLGVLILKQKLIWTDILATALCYGGVVIISTQGDPLSLQFSDPMGVGLALGSTIIWALFWIYNTRDTRDPVVAMCLNFTFGIPWIIFSTWLFFGLRWPSLPGTLAALYVGCFEMGITFLLWLAALKHAVNTSRVANLIFIAPFLSLTFIAMVVGETIRSSTLVGLLAIVFGLIIQQAGARKKRAPAA